MISTHHDKYDDGHGDDNDEDDKYNMMIMSMYDDEYVQYDYSKVLVSIMMVTMML